MNVPILLIEVLSFVISITLFFQVSVPLYLKLFSTFLLMTLIVEITAWKLVTFGINVTLLYNFFTAFEFEFYLFVLRGIIQNFRIKKVISQVLWLYPVLVFLNVSLIQKNAFHSVTYSIGCLLVVAACI